MADDYLTVEHLNTKKLACIFSKIKIDPAITHKGVPCWIWTGCPHNKPHSYGVIAWKRRATGIHRILYAWAYKTPLPQGSVHQNGQRPELDHLCRNRRCCNPAHLELVSRQENQLRGAGTTLHGKRFCPNGHDLQEVGMYVTGKAKQRGCFQCRRDRDLAYYYKRKAEGGDIFLAERAALQKRYSLTRRRKSS